MTQRAVYLAHVFISHGHPDHIGAVPQHVAWRRLLNLPPASYYVPPCCVQPLRAVLHAMAELDGNPTTSLAEHAQVVAMLPSEIAATNARSGDVDDEARFIYNQSLLPAPALALALVRSPP